MRAGTHCRATKRAPSPPSSYCRIAYHVTSLTPFNFTILRSSPPYLTAMAALSANSAYSGATTLGAFCSPRCEDVTHARFVVFRCFSSPGARFVSNGTFDYQVFSGGLSTSCVTKVSFVCGDGSPSLVERIEDDVGCGRRLKIAASVACGIDFATGKEFASTSSEFDPPTRTAQEFAVQARTPLTSHCSCLWADSQSSSRSSTSTSSSTHSASANTRSVTATSTSTAATIDGPAALKTR